MLRGSLAPADKTQQQTIETRVKPNEATRIIEGETMGKTTLLSLDEASVYFALARNDQNQLQNLLQRSKLLAFVLAN